DAVRELSVFCPECGTWNRALAASCSRCSATLPDVASTPTEKPDEEITALRRATGARYRILKRVGGGGMATVFRAEQMPLAREVIVKVLHAHLARDSEMTERFRREAEAAARLVHPFICPVLDFGEMDETVYIVMPYLGGGSLADRVQRERTVAPGPAAAAAADACSGGYKHVHEKPVPISEIDSRVPEPLAAIVMRCLEKSAADRYERGTALADALIGFLAGEGDATPSHRQAILARIRTP